MTTSQQLAIAQAKKDRGYQITEQRHRLDGPYGDFIDPYFDDLEELRSKFSLSSILGIREPRDFAEVDV